MAARGTSRVSVALRTRGRTGMVASDPGGGDPVDDGGAPCRRRECRLRCDRGSRRRWSDAAGRAPSRASGQPLKGRSMTEIRVHSASVPRVPRQRCKQIVCLPGVMQRWNRIRAALESRRNRAGTALETRSPKPLAERDRLPRRVSAVKSAPARPRRRRPCRRIPTDARTALPWSVIRYRRSQPCTQVGPRRVERPAGRPAAAVRSSTLARRGWGRGRCAVVEVVVDDACAGDDSALAVAHGVPLHHRAVGAARDTPPCWRGRPRAARPSIPNQRAASSSSSGMVSAGG